jgi:hypothetical protein
VSNDAAMHKLQTLFRPLDTPLHYIEDDALSVGDQIDVLYRGAPLRVKVVEVRGVTESHMLGDEHIGARRARMCIVVRPRPATEAPMPQGDG